MGALLKKNTLSDMSIKMLFLTRVARIIIVGKTKSNDDWHLFIVVKFLWQFYFWLNFALLLGVRTEIKNSWKQISNFVQVGLLHEGFSYLVGVTTLDYFISRRRVQGGPYKSQNWKFKNSHDKFIFLGKFFIWSFNILHKLLNRCWIVSVTPIRHGSLQKIV